MAINEVRLSVRITNTRTAVAVFRVAFLSRFLIGSKRASRFAMWAAKKVVRTEIAMV